MNNGWIALFIFLGWVLGIFFSAYFFMLMEPKPDETSENDDYELTDDQSSITDGSLVTLSILWPVTIPIYVFFLILIGFYYIPRFTRKLVMAYRKKMNIVKDDSISYRYYRD